MSFAATHLIGFGAGGGIGGIDSSTKLMLHCDGADASTTFTDSSAFGHNATANNQAQVDTAQSKFGGASALFDGTSDTLTIASHADFAIGTGDFTVDFWVRISAFSPNALQGAWNIGSYLSGMLIRLRAAQIEVLVNGAGTDYGTSTSITINTGTWYHIAVARSGTSIKLFLDGVTKKTSVSSDNIPQGAVTIGASQHDGSECINGWMDEIRLSVGAARWTGDFTPPTEPYS